MKAKLLLYSLILIFLESCASMHLKVTEEAEIKLPDDIKKFVVARGNISDTVNADFCLKGLTDAISHFAKYKTTKLVLNHESALDWKDVEDICKSNHADALIVLKTLDENLPHTSRVDVNIKATWQIYGYKNKNIIDDFSYSDSYLGIHYFGKNYTNIGQSLSDAAHYAGAQYAKRISPHWIEVKRHFYFRGGGIV